MGWVVPGIVIVGRQTNETEKQVSTRDNAKAITLDANLGLS